ncbi:MAG: NADP-dependent oxidoreductase [Hyphomicrobiales bacterium]|nr:NADP-dependent oxidoreductase [Hyphomicrobiales bacterium]MDE2114834.1 NADP-dependent oxidoreductase [Hyphomicrobiales bacterium]
MLENQRIVLASRPTGAAGPENFRLENVTLGEPGEGQVLVRHHYLSLDPYMRGRMNDSRSYAAAQKLDDVMIGGTVGEVIASHNPRFAKGDYVVGMGGWQNFALSDGKDLQKISTSGLPIQAYLGPVGMPGVTAWYGLNKIIAPKAGETVLVSAATGAVGSVVGQLARLAGARAVGIAGGPAKCQYAVSQLGYDACVDHRAPDFADALKRALPSGIDGLFENVGGLPLQLAFRRLNPFARIAVCGLVASRYDGTASAIPDISPILTMRVKMEGFIVSEHLDIWPQALGELAAHIGAGRIKYRETIAQGLEAAPAAFFGMLKGENFGKQLVKLV